MRARALKLKQKTNENNKKCFYLLYEPPFYSYTSRVAICTPVPLLSVVVPEWPEEDSHRRELFPLLESEIQIEIEILKRRSIRYDQRTANVSLKCLQNYNTQLYTQL